MDLLGVAAVLLDARGRVVLWSPQAERLFGYTASEALGQYAAPLLIREQDRHLVLRLFDHVMRTGENWSGAFPIRRKDGRVRLVEFRNARLQDVHGEFYALGIATDEATLSQVERDVAVSTGLVSQAATGLMVLDTDLRYVVVNPALERMSGFPAREHIGRRISDLWPSPRSDEIESAIRGVLETGTPLLDEQFVGRTAADPDEDHAWSGSFYRLEDANGAVLGVAGSIVDVTSRYQTATEAAEARRRLGLIADASVRIGTTLEVERTARELAEVAVDGLADIVAVDVLDAVLGDHRCKAEEAPLFRALAVASAYPTEAVRAADPPGHIARYGTDRHVTQCVGTGTPVLISHVDDEALRGIAREPEMVTVLRDAGVHSYLAVPLIARGEVLGALVLYRARNPKPIEEDDRTLAAELGSRAAVCIDNARLYENMRNTATALQRSLLPKVPSHHPGLDVATRYQPAEARSQVGGDWYDVIPLGDDRTALVVGDVMGSGVKAAAAMGRLRTATGILADLDLGPADVLHHLDRIIRGTEYYIATCLYVVYDPHDGVCDIACSGHLPPAVFRYGGKPELLNIEPGVPLGVGGISFRVTSVELAPGDELVLYTDGLVESRRQPFDRGLDALLHLLERSDRDLEKTCNLLLREVRPPDHHDDVALLIARTHGL